MWKLYGRRLDGFVNDDHPSEDRPGGTRLLHRGAEIDRQKNRAKYDLDFTGDRMPKGEGHAIADEDRRTIVRWIDLGCPIDLDYDPANPGKPGFGWMLDDQRPTLTVTLPHRGANAELTRFVIGMYDYGTGLDADTFRVTADFEVNGIAAGENLAGQFRPTAEGVRELRLAKPIGDTRERTLTVSVADRQGNVTRVTRRFTAGKK